ncbi:hypothetical protein [Psychroserpens algicola]|uniref:Uncharacterized protein n=1 Tax=Psychroserpens algicola TaxID=1719034 RepID=A0ABT0H966_9FLAO|nr:hypothetical protein [Psychroserpens algicola]MCK8480917.1 hypothetical protein [Psychroserpens algicola]
MEEFYFLFEDLNNWDVWTDTGYITAFIILVTTSIIVSAIYYLLLGRISMRYSTMGNWFLFSMINLILVFILTITIEGILIFDLVFGEFFPKLWIFTFINSFYSFVLYLLLSLVFKRFSIFSKFIPVKF